MNERTGKADWISAYLEWMDPETAAGAEGRLGCSGLEVAGAAHDGFISAYLEWLDAAPRARERSAQHRACDGDGDASRQDDLREALQVALRTESDCIRFLKQVLEAGGNTTRALGGVSEALQRAERLLEDEQSTLTARYPSDAKPACAAFRPTA